MKHKEDKFIEEVRLLFEKYKIEYLKVTTMRTVLDNKINSYLITYKDA